MKLPENQSLFAKRSVRKTDRQTTVHLQQTDFLNVCSRVFKQALMTKNVYFKY